MIVLMTTVAIPNLDVKVCTQKNDLTQGKLPTFLNENRN